MLALFVGLTEQWTECFQCITVTQILFLTWIHDNDLIFTTLLYFPPGMDWNFPSFDPIYFK